MYSSRAFKKFKEENACMHVCIVNNIFILYVSFDIILIKFFNSSNLIAPQAAVRLGKEKVIRALLQHGAFPHINMATDFTLLHRIFAPPSCDDTVLRRTLGTTVGDTLEVGAIPVSELSSLKAMLPMDDEEFAAFGMLRQCTHVGLLEEKFRMPDWAWPL